MMVQSSIDRYYDLNRKFLSMIGLWPYQRFRIILVTLSLGLLVSYTTFQLMALVTLELDMNIATKFLSQFLPFMLSIVNYNSFLLNRTRIKHMIERMRDEWAILKAPDEVDILRRYANISRKFTLYSMVSMISVLLANILFQFLPGILDIVVPLNESRDYQFPYVVEYFVDQKRYFYLIVTHIVLAGFIGTITVVASGTMLMGLLLHICAMLKIAGHRLEHINDEVASTSLLSTLEKDRIICERIISVVDIHRRAIEFAEFILSSFMIFYFLLLVFGISSLSINMFQFFQCLLSTNDTNGMILSTLLIIAHFGYLFVANLAGQMVTDHNSDIFNKVGTVQWYAVSIQAQKMLLIILQRNTKNYYLIIGGIFSGSLEGFASLASMSISYFTMMYSMQ